MDPASLCFQTSFSLCLLKCESQFHQFPVHSCKTEQMNPPWPMEPFIYWHIQSLLKDLLLCHEHWAIHHLSLLAHLLNPQPQCMIYIRPCDNPWSFGWQGIGIWLHIGFHVWALPQFAWKCGLTEDQCTLRPCCKIFHNFSLIDWLRKHVHIQVDCHPIIQGEVFPLCLLNQSCGRLQVSFDGPWRCSQPCWAASMCCFWCLCFHSSHSMVGDKESSKQLRCKKFIPLWFLLNTADWLWLAVISSDWWVKLYFIFNSHTAKPHQRPIQYTICKKGQFQ